MGIGVRYYSLCWCIGFVFGYIIIRELFIREKIDTKLVDNLLCYVIIGTLAGARLGHCLFYDWNYYSHHLLEIVLPISISTSGIRFTGYAGLASHGGAIGITIALVAFYRKYRIPLLSLLDKLAFVAPLAGAFIRIGNFFNSEIVGAPSSVPWAVVFARVDMLPRHPAQLYEAIAYIIIFIILSLFYKNTGKVKIRNGFVFGLSISLIFISRFIIEYCKEVQETFEIGLRDTIGMDMGQILSIPFIVAGLIISVRSLYLTWKDRKKRGGPSRPASQHIY